MSELCISCIWVPIDGKLATCMDKSEGTSSIHPPPRLQWQGRVISLRRLSLFIKFQLGTVSKGHRCASFRVCTRRDLKKTTRHHRRSSSAQLSGGFEVLPLPSNPLKKEQVKKKQEKKTKKNKNKLMRVKPQCLQGEFWTR